MSDPRLTSIWYCQACGNYNDMVSATCLRCLRPFRLSQAVTDEPPPVRQSLLNSPGEFYRWLPWMTAWYLLVLGGLLVLIGGLGVPVLLVSTPALMRLFAISQERATWPPGPPMPELGWLAGLALGVGLFLAVPILFATACLPVALVYVALNGSYPVDERLVVGVIGSALALTAAGCDCLVGWIFRLENRGPKEEERTWTSN
jgi:hypothetical protein